MAKSEIRLKYSGLIVFASRLLSVATGIAFVLMITRSVSEKQFGIWGNINDVFRTTFSATSSYSLASSRSGQPAS